MPSLLLHVFDLDIPYTCISQVYTMRDATETGSKIQDQSVYVSDAMPTPGIDEVSSIALVA